MKKIIFPLLVMTSFWARAEVVCQEYKVSGDIKVFQICAHKNVDGSLSGPELIGENGSWQISKGFSPRKRANKICRALGSYSADSFEVERCLQEQVPINMKGNYSTSNFFPSQGTGECITELTCK